MWVESQITAQILCQILTETQADSMTLFILNTTVSISSLEKWFKQVFLIFLRNPHSLIRHNYFDLILVSTSFLLFLYINIHRFASFTKFNGVLKQIDQYLLSPQSIHHE